MQQARFSVSEQLFFREADIQFCEGVESSVAIDEDAFYLGLGYLFGIGVEEPDVLS